MSVFIFQNFMVLSDLGLVVGILAVNFGKKRLMYQVDINQKRIEQLDEGRDITLEVDKFKGKKA